MTMKNNYSSGIPTISSPSGNVCKKVIGGEHLFLLLITTVCSVSSVYVMATLPCSLGLGDFQAPEILPLNRRGRDLMFFLDTC